MVRREQGSRNPEKADGAEHRRRRRAGGRGLCLQNAISPSPATTFVGAAAAEGELDTSRLPRIAGAKDTYVSAPTTIFISPDTVADTAEVTAKALAAEGWLRYERPFTATAENPNLAIMSLKKGAQGLNVFITLAPAQANKTSVSYTAIAFANDLPVPADATAIEFDPDRPYLSCLTSGAVDATMTFLNRRPGRARLVALVDQGANQEDQCLRGHRERQVLLLRSRRSRRAGCRAAA